MSHSKLLVQGGKSLNGTVSIAGAKNAILPLMAATLLTNRPVEFSNVPEISDVDAMIKLLRSYGAEITKTRSSLRIEASAVRPCPTGCNAEIGRTFRASILVLGPLLASLREAYVYLPGGDNIASQGRGVDFHINNLRGMGAQVDVNGTYIDAKVPQGSQLHGRNIVFSKVSVGATQNITMAACAASGLTTIEGASIEPETLDLIKLLQRMGADIVVDKQNRKITIHGKPVQHYSGMSPIKHTVIPDRIEAGTYAIAAAITNGRIEMEMNVSDQEILNLLESEFWRLLASGVQVTRTRPGCIVVERQTPNILPVSVQTKPYPGFPTDMHPQWAALMCFSDGQCWIEENVFDKRFNYVNELQKMGAAIERVPFQLKKVNIDGTRMRNQPQHYSDELQSYCNDVQATDIRAGAALILAALAKSELTLIHDIEHVERGYEKFVQKFQSCGAEMELY